MTLFLKDWVHFCHILYMIAEKLIAYLSRTLSFSEKNYSQREKEILAIIFVLNNFTNIYLTDMSLY